MTWKKVYASATQQQQQNLTVFNNLLMELVLMLCSKTRLGPTAGACAAAPLRAEPVIAGVLSQSDTQRVSLAPALCKLYIIGTPSPK